MPDHGHHPGIHQLLGHGLAGGRVSLVVHGHHLQGDALAVHRVAALVQLRHCQVDAVEQILPQGAQWPGKGLGHTDLDGVGHLAAACQHQQRGYRHGGQGQADRCTPPVNVLIHANPLE